MRVLGRFVLVLLFCCSVQAFAAPSLGSVAQGLTGPLDIFRQAFAGIGAILGVFFLFTAWIRWTRYRQNSQEQPISNVIAYALVGIAFLLLTLVYHFSHYEAIHTGMRDVAS